MLLVIFNAVSARLVAERDKPKTSVVVMRMRKIFLLQNKCRVGKVCKNRCLAVDLITFYRKISAACVLILPGI